MTKPISYSDAGVDIDAATRATDRIRELARRTFQYQRSDGTPYIEIPPPQQQRQAQRGGYCLAEAFVPER